MTAKEATPRGPFDAIVIGSGIAGMTTAAALAFTGGRVLVLERHFQPGGCTQTFRRRAFEWDVGVHLLGAAHERADWYLQLMALSGGKIGFEHVGPVTDRISFPGLEIDVPPTFDEYGQVLANLFPGERDGIHAYLAEVAGIHAGVRGYFGVSAAPRPLTLLARHTVLRGSHRAATTTTERMMTRFVADERLKDVLDAQWLNIGMPRRESSFLAHATALGYYLDGGGYYPRGGASVFARDLGRTVEDAGGAIRLGADVDRVLVRRGRAAGVALADGEEIPAELVVSAIGINTTYGRLLRDEPRADAERAEVSKLRLAYEYMNLFVGLDVSVEEFGIGRENRWIHGDWNTSEDVPWNLADDERDRGPKVLCLNSSSLRDPTAREGRHGHCLQAVFIGAQGVTDRWAHTTWRARSDDYLAWKELVASRLIALLDRRFPGIAGHVAHAEISSPLTYRFFTAHAGGVPFGVAVVPGRFRARSLRPQSPIGGLYLCGQDCVMPGVAAAFGSAILCSSLIRRRNMSSLLRREGRALLGIRRSAG